MFTFHPAGEPTTTLKFAVCCQLISCPVDPNMYQGAPPAHWSIVLMLWDCVFNSDHTAQSSAVLLDMWWKVSKLMMKPRLFQLLLIYI